MYIKQLDIYGVRNLGNAKLSFTPKINAFYGSNGSGKTSILEAIYLLGRGRSFRAATKNVIQFGQQKYVVAAQAVGNAAGAEYTVRLGTEKSRDGDKTVFTKNGSTCQLSEIAQVLPLTLLDSSSFALVDGGPAIRREFIDFAMFHVERSFLVIAQQFKRALAQRNAELKLKAPPLQKRQHVEPWDDIFVRAGEAITKARRQFLQDLQPLLEMILAEWQYSGKILLRYQQGWPENMSLAEALEDGFILDCLSGFSNRGPQRAELEIYIDGVLAKNILSRGQQKVFVCALLLAKAQLLLEKTAINSIFLVDDLGSELDQASLRLVLSKLLAIGGQLFVTGIEKEPLLHGLETAYVGADSSFFDNFKLFHVEQDGEIVFMDVTEAFCC